ncbi:MAG: S8 family serine peptidase [Chloroflexi bacterium]|nr:S8 family serine peptidase [Chloroflexota bacterium]
MSLNRRIFSGVLIFILLIAGIILSAQPTPARSDDTPTARLIESDDPLVQRSGSWTSQAAAGASGGSYLYSGKSVDDVLTLEFVGPRIEIIYVQNPALGALAIEVDGTVLRTVMTDGKTPQFGNHAIVDYLDNGPHTLKVYPQEGTVIGVDAFYIPAAPTATAPTPTIPPTSTPIPRNIDDTKFGDGVMAAAQDKGPIRVIVQLRTPSIGFGRAEFNPRLNNQMQNDVLATISGKFDLRYQYSHLPAIAGYADFATLVQLQANPLVESIVIDEPSSMHMGQSGPAIQADVVRDTYGLRGRGVTIAVLDTGIDTNHPDLSDDIIAQHCETQGSCPPSNTASGISAEDANGHGTNVSGVVTSNGVVAPIGFAPDAKIVAVRVLDASGAGFVSDWVDGLNWVIANQSTLDVDIINMSLGTNALYANATTCNSAQPTVLTAVTTLINNGVTIFASSGNQGSSTALASPSCNTGVVAVGATYDSDLGREPDAGTYNTLFGGSWPACFDAATNTTTITCFTNSNAELDLLAPGSQITSAGMGGGTSTYRGTSQASPTAAGVAALMLEANPTLTPAQIQSVLYTTGVNVTDSKNGFTFRRINALSAVQYVLPDEGAGAPTNDLFAGATVVSSLPYRRTQEVYQATTTGTDPSAGTLCSVSTRSDTVWYSYFAPASQTVSITTEGSTYDTVVGVYTGTEGALTLVGCNDDTDGLHNIRSSALNFNATGGTTYRIMIAKFGTASVGTSVLRLSISNTPQGDSIALFNSTTNIGSLVDSLATTPAIANYATYPTGFSTTGGQWVMGDWNGDGQKTPGVYVSGAFYFTNGIGYTGTWTSIWIGLVGRPAVAGRFDNSAANDCIGAVDSANFPPYGIAYAMYFTCNLTSGPTPPLTFQWLSVLLPDSQGHTGTAQFVAGDWNSDGVESIAIRRTNYIAYTNVPPTTLESAFDQAQYFGTPSAVSYGTLVAGDWDSDRVDSFGLVYSNGAFYRRNDLQWNSGQYTLQNLGQPTGTINFATSWRQR